MKKFAGCWEKEGIIINALYKEIDFCGYHKIGCFKDNHMKKEIEKVEKGWCY